MQPSGIRISEAHKYVGVGRGVFDKFFRPYPTVVEFTPGTKVVRRIDLDRLFDEYYQSNGCPGSGATRCQSEQRESTNGGHATTKATGGRSTKSSTVTAFDAALARATTRKPSGD